MPKAIFNLNEFKTQVLGSNVARTERFETQITFPGQIIQTEKDRIMSLMCEECNIPGVIVQNRPVKYNNRIQYQPTGIDYLGQEATFVFYLQSDWLQRNMIEMWINAVVDPKTRELAYKNDIVGEIKVIPVKRDAVDANTGYCLHRVIPRTIAVMPMSQGTSGVARTTVTFSFDSWSSEKIDSDV